MERYICIHGHFYQPPRENPWLEEIELQESAYPYHDWNERVTAECYSPNTASRILDKEQKITDIVNNYKKISFNFGPTLLSWMEKHAVDVYEGILTADQESQKIFSGHGSAMAQVYNHMIMPLANTRDKITQVVWGIADFEYRFKRKPEGMWLAETAVDIETLEILSDQGVKFIILAPHQAARVRKMDEKKWKDVTGAKIDPKFSYLCRLPSGRTINIFFYDGPIAQNVAFGDLLKDGVNLANRLLNTFSNEAKGSALVHIATDGETYGHHHRYGEMALAYCLYYIEQNNLAKITIYGEYLEKNPPVYEVEIVENSSWSCVHGVERWRSDCGCGIGGNVGWNQKWRAPLRKALDWLRDEVAPIYEKEIFAFCDDPWELRNNYIKVILERSEQNVEKFLTSNLKRGISPEEKSKVLKLLEMQRNAMLMYTSCGWFFNDISGIEAIQVLFYASRVMQLAAEVNGDNFEEAFLLILETAPSNSPDIKNGAAVYKKYVRPAVTDLLRVGAHYAVSSLFETYNKKVKIYCYTVQNQIHDHFEMGKLKLAVGKAPIRSDITGEEDIISYAVLHLGDHNLISGVRKFIDDKACARMHQEIKDAFRKNDIPLTISLIEKNFDKGIFSLFHLFKDEQSKILYQVLDSTLLEIENSLRKINEYHYPIIQVIRQLRIPLPKVLSHMVLVMVNKDLLDALGSDTPDFQRIEELVTEVKDWNLEIDKVTLGFVVRKKVNEIMEKLEHIPYETRLLGIVENILHALQPLHLDLDLWKAQNVYFAMAKKHYGNMKEQSARGNEVAKKWILYFERIGEYLKVRI